METMMKIIAIIFAMIIGFTGGYNMKDEDCFIGILGALTAYIITYPIQMAVDILI